MGRRESLDVCRASRQSVQPWRLGNGHFDSAGADKRQLPGPVGLEVVDVARIGAGMLDARRPLVVYIVYEFMITTKITPPWYLVSRD